LTISSPSEALVTEKARCCGGGSSVRLRSVALRDSTPRFAAPNRSAEYK
jgi:hypothetical protein